MKPVKAWCVKNSDGDLINGTVHSSRINSEYLGQYRFNMNYDDFLAHGYKVVPIQITEIKEADDDS